MSSVEVSCRDLALGFSVHPTPQPLTPTGVGGAYRTVKRCAIGKARRLIQRGIDPGFIHLESGNPLLDIGRSANSPQSRNCLGAALIRRRLCGGGLSGLPVHSDDQFLSQGFGPVNTFPLGLLSLPRRERSEQASSWGGVASSRASVHDKSYPAQERAWARHSSPLRGIGTGTARHERG